MSERTKLIIERGEGLLLPITRRRFLGTLGAAGVVVLLPSVFAGCSDISTDPGESPGYTLDLSTDVGILNYAYALEQVEAAFYSAAIGSAGFATLGGGEQEVFTDIQRHEVIHREFLARALGSSAIPAIAINTATLGTLTATVATLLSTAQSLEDTGVSAYNGAAKYLAGAANLVAAAAIVSVEARHAAAIRDIRDARGANTARLFAGDDVVNAAGLDVKAEPGTVLAALSNLGLVTSPLAIGTAPAGAATPDAPAPPPA